MNTSYIECTRTSGCRAGLLDSTVISHASTDSNGIVRIVSRYQRSKQMYKLMFTL